MANRENEVSCITPGRRPRENKVTRIISVLQYHNSVTIGEIDG